MFRKIYNSFIINNSGTFPQLEVESMMTSVCTFHYVKFGKFAELTVDVDVLESVEYGLHELVVEGPQLIVVQLEPF